MFSFGVEGVIVFVYWGVRVEEGAVIETNKLGFSKFYHWKNTHLKKGRKEHIKGLYIPEQNE